MNNATSGRPMPTEAELRSAYERSRKAGWPVTFEAAMADPFYSKLLTLNAKHPPRAARQQSAPAALRHGPGTPFGVPRTARKPSPGVDRKRAAAGDRDDD